MLHISKIVIKNFRPYYNIQTFEFGDTNGLSVILGNNGVGKTSLLKAIRFALYDELEGYGTSKIKNELNVLAWEEQSFEMYVAIEFSYGNDKYFLKRVIRPHAYIQGYPKNDSDFEHSVTLQKNGRFPSTIEQNNILNNIIPKKISEYILFEGETISKYKNLLDNEKNIEIYESIRKILGITTLENSKLDLEKQLNKYNFERVKLAREQEKNKKISEELGKYKEQQDQYKKERIDIQEAIKQTESDRDRCLEILANNQRTYALLEDRAKKSSELKTIEERINDIKDSVKNTLKNYQCFCSDNVREKIKEIQIKTNDTKQKKDDNGKLLDEISSLQDLLKNSKCKYCGQDIVDSQLSRICSEIDLKKSKFIPITENELFELRKSEQISNTLDKTIRDFENKNLVSDINKHEMEMGALLIKEEKCQYEINRIKNQIETYGGDKNIEQTAKQFSDAEKKVSIYQETLSGLENKITKLQKDIESLINKNSSDIKLDTINKKIEKTQRLISVFDKSIEKFSEQMRNQVQEDATSMFKQISENDEYDRLEFDNQYGLKLIDKYNRVVPNISSGYMTLITISLIYGLHKNSTLTGTIILDAPFSVLTNSHREKIIQTFQKLSPQVLLLAYKDQIDLQNLRDVMSSHLLKEYEIYQDKQEKDSIYKTSIKEMA